MRASLLFSFANPVNFPSASHSPRTVRFEFVVPVAVTVACVSAIEASSPRDPWPGRLALVLVLGVGVLIARVRCRRVLVYGSCLVLSVFARLTLVLGVERARPQYGEARDLSVTADPFIWSTGRCVFLLFLRASVLTASRATTLRWSCARWRREAERGGSRTRQVRRAVRKLSGVRCSQTTVSATRRPSARSSVAAQSSPVTQAAAVRRRLAPVSGARPRFCLPSPSSRSHDIHVSSSVGEAARPCTGVCSQRKRASSVVPETRPSASAVGSAGFESRLAQLLLSHPSSSLPLSPSATRPRDQTQNRRAGAINRVSHVVQRGVGGDHDPCAVSSEAAAARPLLHSAAA